MSIAISRTAYCGRSFAGTGNLLTSCMRLIDTMTATFHSHSNIQGILLKYSTILKPVALAFALATSSSSFAQYSFVDGTTTLALSQYLLTVDDILSVSTKQLIGSTSTVSGTGVDISPAGQDYGTLFDPVTINQGTTSAVFSGNTIASISQQGSGAQQTRTVVKVGVQTINTVTLQNFMYDNAQRTLYADMYTKQGTYLHQAFLVASAGTETDPGAFTISPTMSADGYYHATGNVTQLVLDGNFDRRTNTSTGALHILATGLGVTGVSVGALDNLDFATLSLDSRFAPAVPEPSTYTMLLGGMVSLAFMARRRKTASALS